MGAPFTIVFGQTECSPVASMTRPDDSLEDKAETLGGPMPGVPKNQLMMHKLMVNQAVAERDSGAPIAADVSRPLSPYHGATD